MALMSVRQLIAPVSGVLLGNGRAEDFYIFPEVFRTEICANQDPTLIAKAIAGQGLLVLPPKRERGAAELFCLRMGPSLGRLEAAVPRHLEDSGRGLKMHIALNFTDIPKKTCEACKHGKANK